MKAAALTIASLALVLTGVAGCGDDGGDGASGAPTDASVDDFCANFLTFGEEFGALGADEDPSAVIKAIKGIADDMIETGTPDDISDDAREGWEISLDAIKDIPDDATQDELMELDSEFSDSEQEKSDAFDDYLAETCDLG